MSRADAVLEGEKGCFVEEEEYEVIEKLKKKLS